MSNVSEFNSSGEETSPPFTIVTSKRNRLKKNNIFSESIPTFNHFLLDVDEADVLNKIAKAKVDLGTSAFYKNIIQNLTNKLPLSKPEIIICFGIGHFSDCLNARYQLAFILLVKELLNIENCVFHEPILWQAEINCLQTLNCQFHRKNLEGKLSLQGTPSLIFLPHCPKQLTNNLLWKNWSPADLKYCILIGNSFQQIIQASFKKSLLHDAEYISKISPHSSEYKINNTFKFGNVFNDTSIHTFNVDLAPKEFWSENPEPEYKDRVELITEELSKKLFLNETINEKL